jgi:hypothetical protein
MSNLDVARAAASVVAAALLMALAAPTGAAEVGYRQVDADNFVFRLRSESALTERVAQEYIARAAQQVCKERQPELGQYQSDAKEFLGNETPEHKPVSFEFTQQVRCVAATQPAGSAAPPPAPVSKEEKDGAAALVLDRTERYFRLINDAKIDQAFQDLTPDSALWDAASWTRLKREFQAMAGPLQRIAITKVTVYENPKSASKPGLYVAADYRNIWQNVPIHCGYLMWLRMENGEFRIIREETGHITAEQWQTMPEAQRQNLVQQLRCR